jgi:TDG/mug DNA glycosylase family protein
VANRNTAAAIGFAPIARQDARILVLGSLPGQKSLTEQEYYAHPQNAFWPIMKEIFAVTGSYAERCACLMHHELAVWDVLQSSVRPGSLDADIRQETAMANDFEAFLREHPRIQGIAFNGKKAQQLFRRMVCIEDFGDLRMIELPSTSPAHAAMTFESKLDLWKAGIRHLRQTTNRSSS